MLLLEAVALAVLYVVRVACEVPVDLEDALDVIYAVSYAVACEVFVLLAVLVACVVV